MRVGRAVQTNSLSRNICFLSYDGVSERGAEMRCSEWFTSGSLNAVLIDSFIIDCHLKIHHKISSCPCDL